MTIETVELNPGSGGEKVLVDTITTIDGLTAPAGAVAQLVKHGYGAAGDYTAVTESTGLPVVPSNITGKFRESFENFTPGATWLLTTGSGDIVQTDGNAVSASYLVISKDPLTANTETTLTYNGTFPMPIEAAVGLSMSQRALGQELSIEMVSTETPLAPVADVAISSISQTTTTLTVNTATPHGLVPGKRIGIKGCLDSRLNYPAVVVATTPSPTQFTVTAGPAGTIASATLSGGAVGYVYFRSALGFAQNGISEIFENASATNASVYARSAAGDALPSGTAGGNHSLTTATTTSVQAINSAYTYAFLPSSEFRINLQADRAQIYDAGIDSTTSSTSRQLRTQVVPDPTKDYTLRFRMTNVDSLPVPTAKIVSAVKSGSATATITTDVPHGLTTADFVNIYGIGDTTNFPNVTTPAIVASTPTSTTFTVVIGSSATATSAGGLVSRAQGSQAIQNTQATVAAQASSTDTQLTLIGSASWALSIGDYVNVYGLRNRSTGADLGFDGAYKVVNLSTSTLVLEPLTGTTLPAPISLTNTGGAMIRRTDARISFVRIFEYLRERVEVMARPAGDASAALTITGSNGLSVSGSVATQLIPNQISIDIASAALTSSNTSASITPSNNSCSNEFNVIATAVSGTNPTLDVVVQESDDTGTNWYDVYHFPRITAIGQYRSPLIPLTGNRIRYVRTVGGTSPSFTHAVNRQQSNSSQPLHRQFFDRTLVVNTINSVTPSFFVEGCSDLNVMVSMGAVTTTAPVLVLEVSPDNANWVQIGADITTAANTNNLLAAAALGRFARIRVKTAGSGATLGFLMVKGIGR